MDTEDKSKCVSEADEAPKKRRGGRFQFSLRSVAFVVVVFGSLLGGYAAYLAESRYQQESIVLLLARGASYYDHAEGKPHDGVWLGLPFPADRVRLIKGPERSDWGVVPGWTCQDDDLRLVTRFNYVEEVHIRESTITDAGLSHLAETSTLREIRFTDCNLINADLAQLAVLPELRTLYLFSSNSDKDSIKKFEQLAPQCTLIDQGALWGSEEPAP